MNDLFIHLSEREIKAAACKGFEERKNSLSRDLDQMRSDIKYLTAQEFKELTLQQHRENQEKLSKLITEKDRLEHEFEVTVTKLKVMRNLNIQIINYNVD